MRDIFRLHKNKTLFSLMRSYILILIIPVILGVVIYLISIAALRTEIISMHRVYLEQSISTIDSYVDSIIRIGNGLNSNKRIGSLYFIPEDKLSPTNLYTGVEIKRDLNSLMLSSPFIKSIDVYFINGGYMIGNTERTAASRMSDTIMSRYNLEYDRWYSMATSTQSHQVEIVDQNRGNSDLLITSPLGYELDNPATLVVLIDGSKITGSFSKLLDDEAGVGQISIEISDGRTLNSALKETSQMDVTIPYSPGNNQRQSFSKGKTTYVHSSSDLLDWIFIYSVPTYTFFAKFRHVLFVLYAYVAFCLFVGLVLATYLSRRSYAPIHKLKVLLRSASVDSPKDDYRFLENAVRSILNEQHGLEIKLKQRTDTLRNDFLRKLVTGATPKSTSAKADVIYDLSFKGDCFATAIFVIVDFGDNFPVADDQEEESSALLNLALSNILSELLPSYISSYLFDVDEKIVCLANSDNRSDLQHELNSCAEQVIESFSSLLGVKLIYTVGTEVETMQDIPRSFQSALSELENTWRKSDSSRRYVRASIEDLAAYLNENFQDPGLSLADLSSTFSLNSSYISHIFKKQMGVGVLEYIQKLRVSEGKKLLLETDLNLSAISLQCGYYSANAFSSVFKKYEHMPPGRYRSLHS